MDTIEESCGAVDARTPRGDEEGARTHLSGYLDGDLFAFAPRPDFMLCRDGRRVGWVEVTTATDRKSMSFYDALADLGDSFTSARLRSDWVLNVDPRTSLKRLDHDHVAEALATSERIIARDSMSEADPETWKRLHLADLREQHSAREILDRYGVTFALPLSRPGTGKVTIQHPPVSSFVHPSLINQLAEKKLAKKRYSLEGLDGERHLFVWVDIFEPTGAALSMGGWTRPQLPDRPPIFPEWATDVWLMPVLAPARLWHCARDVGTWELLDVDP